MGNLTAKTSGEIASFMTPAETNIKSLKVHFSPKQLGEGDPSPDNVREIVGWDGVEVNGCGKNIAHIVGYSAQNSDSNNSRVISNSYGTIINTTEFSLPDTKLIITQTQYPNEAVYHYQNGYCAVLVDNLIWGQKYNVSFRIDNIINNPLNAELKDIKLINPYGNFYASIVIDDNHVVFKNVLWKQYPSTVNRRNFEIRICGMSFTLSEFMVTSVDEDDFEYKPYQGNIISYQWKLPDEYQEVEYIESTGTQYIKTNISTNNLISVDLLAQFTEGGDVSQVLFSASTNGVNWFGQRDNVYACGVSDISKSTVDSTQKSKIHIAFSDNSIVCTIGDNTFSRKDSVHQNGQLYKLFNTDYPSKAKIFYCIIYNDDIAIANLVPCYRKSDNEIGMYDTVSQTFYTNQGTGTFLKGEDVNKTFYGGYVDLVSGELVEEWGMFTVDEPDTTWKVNHPARIIINFPRKYIFSSRTMPRKSMCTIIPERSSADFNYGYLDNVSSIEHDHVLFLNYTGNGEGWAELFGEEATNENVKPHLQELGFAICATLVEPITHQLTPTQLSSFIGQNNFWSNADYVEIEYELKETEDIQKVRKKIILNQPHIETLTGGNRILFNSDMKSNLKQCKVSFLPQQEGSGSPSPTNIRTISGWTGVDVYYNDMKYDIDWTNDVGTVYGGYVDFVSGEIVQEDYLFEITPETTISSSGTSAGGTYRIVYDLPYVGTNKSAIACDCYGLRDRNSEMWNYTTKKYLQLYPFNRNVNQVVLGAPQEVTTQQEWLDYLTELGQIRIVYELAEPISYPLTPQQMIILKNTNTFYTNPKNNIEIKSWALKSLIPTTDYLSNVTWTEHAYIGGNGKMASQDTSASHYTTDPISLEAGTYNLKGFSYYNGTDKTRFRIHRYYNSRDAWVEQITFDTIGNLSPVDMTFTLANVSRIRLSIAMDFNGTLTKIS